MYHHVLKCPPSDYPELKYLQFERFCKQLDYIQKNYTTISAEDLSAALDGKLRLPDKTCFLTFDDGYLEHYQHVFPELKRRCMPAAFYPPVMATERKQLLDINKIHLLLATIGYSNIDTLVNYLQQAYISLSDQNPSDSAQRFAELYATYAKPSRFDNAKTMFVKSLLQHGLDEPLRDKVITHLFEQFVPDDEATLAKNYYMSFDMLAEMATNGMHIGSHGNNHLWLDKLSPGEQRQEIDASLRMLEKIYQTDKVNWSMCYPFGGYTSSLSAICKEKGCQFAVTTKPGYAELSEENRFALARVDTNDIPLS